MVIAIVVPGIAEASVRRFWARLDHCQDADFGDLREGRPSIDHQLQIGREFSGLCAKCAGFCAALVRNRSFFRQIRGTFESLPDYRLTSGSAAIAVFPGVLLISLVSCSGLFPVRRYPILYPLGAGCSLEVRVGSLQVSEDQLTIHSDRGPSMASQTVAQLLATLGVVKSHSRPHVSNDNPFSESPFKTMKYRPEFPKRLDGFEDALGPCSSFFEWYNDEHYHSGIGLLTPAMLQYGEAKEVIEDRANVLQGAYAACLCSASRTVRRGGPKP